MTSPQIAADLKTNLKQLINHLHRDGIWAHLWTDHKLQSHWFRVDEPEDRIVPKGWLAHNVYFTVNPLSAIPPHNASGNTKRENIGSQYDYVCAVNCLYAEYDGKDFVQPDEYAPYLPAEYAELPTGKQKEATKAAREETFYADAETFNRRALDVIDALEYRPSVCVHSGGGYHCYWLLADTVPLDEENRDDVQATQYGWVQMVGADPGVSDLRRILRFPGTRNRKAGFGDDSPLVSFVWADFDLVYDYATLEEAVSDWLFENRPKTDDRPTPKNDAGPSDDVRSRFNHKHTLDAILSKHDYTLCYEAGVFSRYARPGREKNEPSITVWPADAETGAPELSIHFSSNDALYSEEYTDPETGRGKRRAHDAYYLYVHLEHDGDWKAAYIAAKKALGLWVEESTNGTGPHREEAASDPDAGGDIEDLVTQAASLPDGDEKENCLRKLFYRLAQVQDDFQRERLKAILPKRLEMSTGAFNNLLKHARKKADAENDKERDTTQATPPPKSFVERSDLATAEYAYSLYAGELAYTSTHGWLHNVGTHWTTDEAKAHAQQRMNDALRKQAERALAGGDTELLKRSIPDARNTRAVLYQFEGLVTISTGELDSAPHLLNCKNGVVDLRTGELVAHDPSNRFTYCVETRYRAGAHLETMPLYSRKMPEWVGDDAETITFLERLYGYGITGETREEIAVWLQGPSRSGKGSMLNTISAILGEPLSKSLAIRALTNERGDPQGFAIAPLRPARFVVASESKKNQRLDAGLLKWITGRDTIQVAHKNKDPFQFRPQFKLFVMSNYLPNVDAGDSAVQGRIKIVKTPNSYYGNEDKDLKDALLSAEQRELLLSLLVAQAGLYYKLGLDVPATVEARSEEVRQAGNPTYQWLGENIERATGESAPLDDWYQDYCDWCNEWGFEPQVKGWFAKTLNEAGYPTKREWDVTSKKKAMRVLNGHLIA